MISLLFASGISLGSFIMMYPDIAGRGLGANRSSIDVYSVKKTATPGLRITDAQIRYDDGDLLSAKFRINCRTGSIQPTNYRLTSETGKIKKQGALWDPPFAPKWRQEHELVKFTCENQPFE